MEMNAMVYMYSGSHVDCAQPMSRIHVKAARHDKLTTARFRYFAPLGHIVFVQPFGSVSTHFYVKKLHHLIT